MKMSGAKKVRWKFEDVGSTPSGRLSTAWQSLSQIELQALMGMLVRQWRLIASITGLLLILAAAILSLLSYRYTAETLLAVDERGSELVGQADPIGSGVTFNNRVDSEVEILNSSSVALGVIDNLALWRDPEFGIDGLSLSEKLKSLIGISPTQKIEHNYVRLSDIPGAQQTQLVDRLQAAIKIGRHGLTSLISIKATSKDSEKAAFIANSVADSYLNVQITAKDKTAQSAVAFLAQRVEELAKDIQLLNARTESFIVDQANALGTPETKTEMLRIKNEINNLASDQADFSARLTRLQSLQLNPASMSLDTIPAELRAIAEERDNAAKAALAEVTDSNVQAQLKELDQKLRDAAQQQSENVRRQLANTDKLKDDLRKQLQEIFIHQSIPNEVSVNLFRLQSESENTRKLYESFSNRLAAVKQQLGFTLPNSRVVAPATIPFRPSYPPTTLLMIGALMLGLVSGVMAAIARENLVGGFILPAQLEAVTGLPVIAAVPLSHSKMPAIGRNFFTGVIIHIIATAIYHSCAPAT